MYKVFGEADRLSKFLWLLRGTERGCLGTDLSPWPCCRGTVRREEKTGTRLERMPR